MPSTARRLGAALAAAAVLAGCGSDDGLADGEVLPGLVLTAPEGTVGRTIEGNGGRTYTGVLDDRNVAVFVEVVPNGPTVDFRVDDVESLAADDGATLDEGPTDVDVPGAEAASRVALTDPRGFVTASTLFATAGSTSISIIVEAPTGSSLDVDAILDSVKIDADRLDADFEPSPPAGG